MSITLQEIIELERELNTKLDLTEREQKMLEAIRYFLDRRARSEGWRDPR